MPPLVGVLSNDEGASAAWCENRTGSDRFISVKGCHVLASPPPPNPNHHLTLVTNQASIFDRVVEKEGVDQEEESIE
jgi:hypothetical protein